MSTATSNVELLERYGLVPEEDLAALLGIGVKSLKNRPLDKLPKFVKHGRRRLYVEESVREFLGLTSAPKARTAPRSYAVDHALSTAINKAVEGATELLAKLATIQALMKARRE